MIPTVINAEVFYVRRPSTDRPINLVVKGTEGGMTVDLSVDLDLPAARDLHDDLSEAIRKAEHA